MLLPFGLLRWLSNLHFLDGTEHLTNTSALGNSTAEHLEVSNSVEKDESSEESKVTELHSPSATSNSLEMRTAPETPETLSADEDFSSASKTVNHQGIVI